MNNKQRLALQYMAKRLMLLEANFASLEELNPNLKRPNEEIEQANEEKAEEMYQRVFGFMLKGD